MASSITPAIANLAIRVTVASVKVSIFIVSRFFRLKASLRIFIADHNECEQLGDGTVGNSNGGHGGHFCTVPHSVCTNTPGSYKCKLVVLALKIGLMYFFGQVNVRLDTKQSTISVFFKAAKQ